jgi:GMP synthase-like glutamine amidotransferase
LNIGLSQRILYHKGRAYDSIEHGWYPYLKEHTLFFIPNDIENDFDLLESQLDALILTGGDDSTLRRVTEIRLASRMLKNHKPILGVCHGCFLLTDLLGGIVKSVDGHSDTEHTIDYFGANILVNSFHNLTIKTPHPTATVLATDSEGNCEAWIDKNIAGVVWHPERMDVPFLPTEIQQLIKI